MEGAMTPSFFCIMKDIKKYNFILLIFIIYFFLPLVYFLLLKTNLYLISAYFEILVWHEYVRYIFYIGLFVILFLTLSHRIQINNSIVLVLFIALAIWITLSTYIAGFDDTVFNGVNLNPQEGLITTFGYFMFLALSVISSDCKQSKILVYIIVSSALVLQILLIHEFFFTNSQVIAKWLFYNPNHFGYYLICAAMSDCMFFMIAEKRWQKILGILLIVIGSEALLINNTLGSYIGYLFGLIFIPIVYSIVNKKWSWKYLVPFGITLITATLSSVFSEKFFEVISYNFSEFLHISKEMSDPKNAPDSLGSGRMVLYRRALEMIREKPLFGWGWQTGTDEIVKLTAKNNKQLSLVHCEYLQYAVFYGIPAAVLYVAGILSVFIRGLKHRAELTDLNIFGLCVAFGYCVSATFGNQMFFTAPFFFIMLGFGFWRKPEVPEVVS